MTIMCSLHQPVKAKAGTYTAARGIAGYVVFEDAEGQQISLYTTPDVAESLAAAFDLFAAPEAGQ